MEAGGRAAAEAEGGRGQTGWGPSTKGPEGHSGELGFVWSH